MLKGSEPGLSVGFLTRRLRHGVVVGGCCVGAGSSGEGCWGGGL